MSNAGDRLATQVSGLPVLPVRARSPKFSSVCGQRPRGDVHVQRSRTPMNPDSKARRLLSVMFSLALVLSGVAGGQGRKLNGPLAYKYSGGVGEFALVP